MGRLLASVVAILLVAGCQQTTKDPAQPVSAPSASVTSKAADPAETDLFQTSCTKCHTLERIEKYKKARPWQEIVDRMIKKHGAEISPEDAAKIVKYLDQTHFK